MHKITDSHKPVPNPLIWLLLAGLDFAILGFICAWFLLRGAAEDWQALRYAAPPAAFLASMFFWRLLVSGKSHKLMLRGAAAGGLTGLFSHPLAWYLAILYFYFSDARSSLGEATLNPLEGIPASCLYAIVSLLAAGWITVPLGAAVGGLMAVAHQAVQKDLYAR
jgi:hypothetical protein